VRQAAPHTFNVGGWAVLKTSELRVKDIINVLDGKRLGFVGDLELDLEQGRVQALVIPGHARWFGLLGRDSDRIIPWAHVQKIGEDVILVKLASETNGLADGRAHQEQQAG
jgi:YlmC/YmxH family sporulation protein